MPTLSKCEKKEANTETADQCYIPRLNKFVPQVTPKISNFSTVSIYGKRKSGKSVFAKWFLQAFRHIIPWGWTFTKTKFNSFWATFMPDKFILGDFNADLLQQIMDRQEIAIQYYLSQDDKNDPFNPIAFVCWDDYMGNEIRFNQKLAEYYYTGRHYYTLNLYCAQHITQTPPSIRSNTDLVILFASDYYNSLDHYYKDFAGRISREAFMYLFNTATSEPHHFLAIVNDPNVPLDEKFFVGCAEELPAKKRYILGCQEYWEESIEQLQAIANGSMQKILDKTRFMAKWRSKRQVDRARDNKNNYTWELTGTNMIERQYPNKNILLGEKLPDISN